MVDQFIPTKHSTGRAKKWLLALLIIVLLAAIGILGWWAKTYRTDKQTLQQENNQLHSQIDSLKKQLDEEKKKKTASSSPTSTCSAEISTTLKNNIKDAIASKNYAALEGYMASSVNVVFAASEKQGGVSPSQAATDLAYLNAATSPWDFALPAATIASYDAGFYTTYFDDNTYVGKSANNYVVSFDFDSCGKINVVFVAANADLLR